MAGTALVRRGTLVFATGAETLYQSASLGKHFTAALALLLRRPAPDAAVAPYLPELPAEWGGITLRHLLSHTAGIPAAGYDGLDYARDYSDAGIVGAISSGGRLEFRPGTGWRYSNAGYVLAGIAMGRATGTFYGDLLRERIFAPLGMRTVAVNGPGPPVGYVREDGVLVRAAYVSPSLNRLADGGLTLSVLDLVRWEAGLSSDWGLQVAEMFQETRLENGEACGYGLGWFLSAGERGRIAEHDGCWQGFSTAMVRYLDEGVTAIVLANAADVDAIGLAHGLARGGGRDGANPNIGPPPGITPP